MQHRIVVLGAGYAGAFSAGGYPRHPQRLTTACPAPPSMPSTWPRQQWQRQEHGAPLIESW
ncbi:hypothetical protein [Nocardia niigatensis]|uniref:hypothetical protein n=1 Tax=Nocardia niigatensis TaxID=209249 RepID=UPI000592BC66|nr:hypothetical protein [Nocardia niigatensis]